MSTSSESDIRKLILVVDDDQAIREIVQDVLEDAGYRVAQAEDGKVAFDGLTSRPTDQPALILLDMMMPVMNGMNFLEALQHAGACARIPVVIMSAFQRVRAPAVPNLVGRLEKPFGIDALVELIRAHCPLPTIDGAQDPNGTNGAAKPPVTNPAAEHIATSASVMVRDRLP